ncbi:MAG TPA: hypothetical protein VFH39_00380 [Candidatus Saccharimonadales bacterium]|nr:hypothetical protein [Candidatus Saccharimonadales bacterium]
MQAKTTNSEQVWQSPDGKRTIWEVQLQGDDGNEYRLKTYSSEIAKLGFKGKVKSYLNKFGERFVRQDVETTETGGGYSRDDNAIRAQWAIGQAINLASVKMDKQEITLPVIEEYAKQLFTTVSRVKGEELSEQEAAAGEAHIKNFTQAAAF